jgi:paraquat-inducible protein B
MHRAPTRTAKMTDLGPSEPPPPPSTTPPAPPPGGGLPPPPNDGIPKAHVARRKRRQISLVWIIPIVALLIGLYLVIHALRTQGPTIDIQFKTAEGLEAGKTKIKYKNVDIGTVQTITLGKDKKGVVVTAQMTRNATDLLVEDTRFWIVKPRIAGGQISGLTTLLSGSYIGMDIGKSTDSERDFVGLDQQPSVTTDEPGREFLLHAQDSGSLDIGSPVLFRRFQVGEVTAVNLDPDGKGVTARVFVRSPNEKYVTQNTRFWEASGIDVSIDGSGVRVQTQSLTSVIVGGIAFQTPAEEPPGPVASNDATFQLFGDERTAMKRSDSQLEKYISYFSDSIRGLSVGAQVEFRGFVIGEVRSIEMEFDRETREIRFPVEFALYRDVLPARIARAEKAGGVPIDSDALYQRAVEKRGLRAQLKTGNLLTGQKYLAMDFVKDAPPVTMQSIKDQHGNRILPTTPGSFDELQESLSSIAKKIDKIPFDQLVGDIRQTLKQLQVSLKNADKLMGNLNDSVAPEVTATLNEVKRTMKGANEVLASDSPLQQDLRGTLAELNRAAASLRLLTDFLQRHPESLIRGKAPDLPFGDVPKTTTSALPAPTPPAQRDVTPAQPETPR